MLPVFVPGSLAGSAFSISVTDSLAGNSFSVLITALFWLATGILEVAADWDEDWDKLEDKGLRDKKCVPCNLKELQPMTKDAAHTLMPQ
ncbi:hypothetical protein S83_012552, partial [Arachis hypogaea]